MKSRSFSETEPCALCLLCFHFFKLQDPGVAFRGYWLAFNWRLTELKLYIYISPVVNGVCCQEYHFAYQWGRFLLLWLDLKVSLKIPLLSSLRKASSWGRVDWSSVSWRRLKEIIAPKLVQVLSDVRIYMTTEHLEIFHLVRFLCKISLCTILNWVFWSLDVKINTDHPQQTR